ncbi:endonuclease VII domain-containing protein [Nocardia sp. NPDC055002]
MAEGIKTKRKIKTDKRGRNVPGPRCATHHRAKTRTRRNYNHTTHIAETYGITSEEYQAIYKYQGGKCFICRRATGARKRLSVDHCHATGRVRGLLCQKCNRDILGHLRDDPEALYRAAEYLNSPPAIRVIGTRVVPNHQESK